MVAESDSNRIRKRFDTGRPQRIPDVLQAIASARISSELGASSRLPAISTSPS